MSWPQHAKRTTGARASCRAGADVAPIAARRAGADVAPIAAPGAAALGAAAGSGIARAIGCRCACACACDMGSPTKTVGRVGSAGTAGAGAGAGAGVRAGAGRGIVDARTAAACTSSKNLAMRPSKALLPLLPVLPQACAAAIAALAAPKKKCCTGSMTGEAGIGSPFAVQPAVPAAARRERTCTHTKDAEPKSSPTSRRVFMTF